MTRIWSVLALTLGVGAALACAGFDEAVEPSRFDEVAEQVEEAPPQPIGAIVAGSDFNALFPDDGHEGYTRTFTQEKEGYAEAEFEKDGAATVTVSISDTRDNPGARDKFANASEQIGAHPMMARGAKSSMALVGGRFQVRVSSPGDLSHEERVPWLKAVDLGALAGMN